MLSGSEIERHGVPVCLQQVACLGVTNDVGLQMTQLNIWLCLDLTVLRQLQLHVQRRDHLGMWQAEPSCNCNHVQLHGCLLNAAAGPSVECVFSAS